MPFFGTVVLATSLVLIILNGKGATLPSPLEMTYAPSEEKPPLGIGVASGTVQWMSGTTKPGSATYGTMVTLILPLYPGTGGGNMHVCTLAAFTIRKYCSAIGRMGERGKKQLRVKQKDEDHQKMEQWHVDTAFIVLVASVKLSLPHSGPYYFMS